MKPNTISAAQPSHGWKPPSASVAPPVEVFYVVQTNGVPGERNHRIRSDLYETRAQAQVELTRIRQTETAGGYSVWKSETYVEPAEWLHRVVRSDGTLILPRLHGLAKFMDA